jgi:hypothetical protein
VGLGAHVFEWAVQGPPAHAFAVTINGTCPPYTVAEATATPSDRQLVSRRQHHLG